MNRKEATKILGSELTALYQFMTSQEAVKTKRSLINVFRVEFFRLINYLDPESRDMIATAIVTLDWSCYAMTCYKMRFEESIDYIRDYIQYN